ncbi:hypothetical protein TSUD_250760 [Trifolium subterraneum]|nr:hypothetical protein TSUD_250760 [Trifolium subterraneum]
MDENDVTNEVVKTKKKGKHDKPKPWDDDPNIDHWKVEKFDPSWNEGGMLEVSSFSTLFPQYREKYLQEAWPLVKSSLKEFGISAELNLVEGSMTVSTTRKTKDPYIIVKARDLIRLLSRSVPAPQAIKILDDEMQCDIIKISGIAAVICRNGSFNEGNHVVATFCNTPKLQFLCSQLIAERFVKRRQHLVGPNSSTLKALEILSGCYILVQGNTVSVMGSYKGLKQVRRIVEECMLNKMHPVYNIKILMMKKELEKDPALAQENWDRKNVKQKKVSAKQKKPYTPFPPPQQPSKVDIQLETGEYFMSDKKKSAKKWQERQEKQAEKTAANKRKRDESFIPPKEPTKPVDNSEDANNNVAEMAMSLKKKAKNFGKRKSEENINAETYIMGSSEQPSSKKSKKQKS